MRFITVLFALFIASTAIAETAVPVNYQPPGYGYCQAHEAECNEVAQFEQYIVLHEPNRECPAGYYYLINNDDQTLVGLETETCSDSVSFKFQRPMDNGPVMAVMYVSGMPRKMFPL